MPDNQRVLIVTGASAGIGAALARAAGRTGYRVAIVARRAERLEEVARAIRDGGGTVVSIVGDVTAGDLPARIVDTTLSSFGRIDAVVNNAGSGALGALLDQTDAAIEAQWRLHVAAPLKLSRAALPHLEAARGQLVFLGSGIARVPLLNYGAYALAKAAIRAAATQLRRELRGRGVAVTYVDPGLVATEFHKAMGIERASDVPAASPERVARAILRGIARRSAVVNAVPLHTAAAALGEWSGTLADPFIISRLTPRKAAAPAQPPPVTPTPVTLSPSTSLRTGSVEGRQATSFDAALEAVARRMERVKLPAQFLRDALVPGAALELNALAMQWAGMPNKNERAALREALDALAAGGYLEPLADETWKVTRGADT
ncbi:MAG TPA: SDR family NAD(P)-dependent oxidoreductase [Candidatus Cybelea sp.]|nr:SDR family NAD(P)-dependent oxidoreductase [Candidatus Cybelea sp.]